MAQLGPLLRASYERAIKVSARAGVSGEGSNGEESASKFTYVVIGKSQVILGCRAEGPSWLSARGHPQFFAMRTSPKWQLASSKPGRGQSANKREVRIFCNLVKEMTCTSVAEFCQLEASYSRGRDYRRYEHQKARILGSAYHRHLCLRHNEHISQF